MPLPQRYAAVVGTFDGLHLGHCYLLDQLKQVAGREGLSTHVFTFTDHPLLTLCPARAPRLLTTTVEKAVLLDSCGLDCYNITDFAPLVGMTAHEYIEYLATLGVELLVLGYDNRFGCDRLQEFDEFVKAAQGTGVRLVKANELLTEDGQPLNSSMIRQFLLQGNVDRANQLLGYTYSLTGHVVKGKQLGRRLGFPTANIEVGNHRKLVPGNGVYACRATVDGGVYRAMVNVGHRPTVDGVDAPVNIEAHIVDFDRDVYGDIITLQFVARLRDEQRFASLNDLQQQLRCDLKALGSLNL